MAREPPFQHQFQLNAELDSLDPRIPLPLTDLPGHPRIKLNDPSRLYSFLQRDLDLKDLESMAPRLWMMSTQSHANISPLHQQIVKGRDIIIAEDPRLHLVWIDDRIYLKPLPSYLLCYHFWESLLLSSTSPLGTGRGPILKAALGYMRTYYFLITHESDFRIALDKNLMPPTTTWKAFCDFSATFGDIKDLDVSGR